MRWIACVLIAIASPAGANPDPVSATEPRPTPPERPAPPTAVPVPVEVPTPAADVANAPLPGQESGRVDGGRPGDSIARQIGRGALYVPRLLFTIGMAPITGVVYANDRYHLGERYRRLFYFADNTIQVNPTIWWESDIGFTGGADFIMTNAFGRYEHIHARGLIGGSYFGQAYLSIDTGDRLGWFRLEGLGNFSRRPNDPFYGIGNADEHDITPAVPLDPINTPVAIQTRYRDQLGRGALVGDAMITPALHFRPAIAIENHQFSVSKQGTPIDEVYDVALLPGFSGFSDTYLEAELRWDSRRPYSHWEPAPVYDVGWLGAVYGGRLFQWSGIDFWRYGVDLQGFYRFAHGPRLIDARFHGEAVTGNINDLPFIDLPALGGWRYLRGYPLDRFRDKLAGVATLEYQWALSQLISANVFVETGRVYGSWSQVTLDNLRWSYGVQLDAHSFDNFILQLGLASSSDGGVQSFFTFTSVLELDERVRRK